MAKTTTFLGNPGAPYGAYYYFDGSGGCGLCASMTGYYRVDVSGTPEEVIVACLPIWLGRPHPNCDCPIDRRMHTSVSCPESEAEQIDWDAEIQDLELDLGVVHAVREEAQAAFENFDMQTRALFRLLSIVLINMREMKATVCRTQLF